MWVSAVLSPPCCNIQREPSKERAGWLLRKESWNLSCWPVSRLFSIASQRLPIDTEGIQNQQTWSFSYLSGDPWGWEGALFPAAGCQADQWEGPVRKNRLCCCIQCILGQSFLVEVSVKPKIQDGNPLSLVILLNIIQRKEVDRTMFLKCPWW